MSLAWGAREVGSACEVPPTDFRLAQPQPGMQEAGFQRQHLQVCLSCPSISCPPSAKVRQSLDRMKAWNRNLEGTCILTQRRETPRGISCHCPGPGAPTRPRPRVPRGSASQERSPEAPYQPCHLPELQEAASPFWGVPGFPTNTLRTTSNSLPPSRVHSPGQAC